MAAHTCNLKNLSNKQIQIQGFSGPFSDICVRNKHKIHFGNNCGLKTYNSLGLILGNVP